MRVRFPAVLLVLALAMGGCATAGGPEGTTPRAASGEAIKPETPEAANAAPRQAVDEPDIANELYATVYLASMQQIAQELQSHGKDLLPTELMEKMTAEALHAALVAKAKDKFIKLLLQQLDLSRPVTSGIADPSQYKLKPFTSGIFAWPIKGTAQDFYAAVKNAFPEQGQWPQMTFSKGGTVKINGGPNKLTVLWVKDGYAYVASDERLARGARKALADVASGQPGHQMGLVDVQFDRIYQKYGMMIEAGLGAFKGALKENPELMGGSFLFRWLDYIKEITGLQLGVEARPADARLVFNIVDGNGKLPQMAKTDFWGVDVLPAESAMVFVNRSSEKSSQEGIDALMEMLGIAQKNGHLKGLGKAKLKRLEKSWRSFVGAVGPMAGGVYATEQGAIAMSGIARVEDPKLVQSSLTKMVAESLAVQKGLLKMLSEGKPTPGLRLRLRKNLVRGLGVKVDGIEISINLKKLFLPPGKKMDKARRNKAKEDAKKAKIALEKLFGKKIVVAWTVVEHGGQRRAIFVLGKDYKEQMRQMVARVKKGESTGLAARVKKNLARSEVGSGYWVSTPALIEQGLRVIQNFSEIPPPVAGAVRGMLPSPGEDAPIALWLDRRGETISTELSVSNQAIRMALKAFIAVRTMQALGNPSP